MAAEGERKHGHTRGLAITTIKSTYSLDVASVRALQDPKLGQFRITERGREVLANEPDTVNTKFLKQFDEFNRFIGKQPSLPESARPDPELTPEQTLHTSYQTLRKSLAADLLDQVKQASPGFFEQLVVDVLVHMGMGVHGRRRERLSVRPATKALTA